MTDDLGSKLMWVGVFLGVFFILAASMPSEFYSAEYEYGTHSIPENFQALDLQYFAETENDTFTKADYSYDYVMGGWNFRWYAYFSDWIDHLRYEKWWIFYTYSKQMTWYSSGGIELGPRIGASDIDDYWDTSTNTTKFYLKDDAVSMPCWFSYNTTNYSNATHAWDNDDLDWLTAIDFDAVKTTYSAWGLIGMLLFFQLPDIHPLLNMIIALPCWICIAYLMYRLILLAIPFVGGS